MRHRLLLLVTLASLAVGGCDDKPTVQPPPFTPSTVMPSNSPTSAPTSEATPPSPSTHTPGKVRTWVKGKLTVQVLDGPDKSFPRPIPGYGQVVFTCGYAAKSTQSILTGINEPWMNKDKPTGDYLNGPANSVMTAAFYSADQPENAMFTRDSWPLVMLQEDSVPLPEISTAHMVRRDKLTMTSLLKVKAVYTAGCMSDLKPGLPADVEIWAPWDWQSDL